ncbi:thiamine thiazole synthase [Desulfosalsimonas propionicica]|uniref:Thiamine thiazole synthase n=1 Tax=Desulfosalsimonas propionicica TaxID=332175 RepID=A0A7W0HJ40_9BACT|nr:sulfide-dependent adenosine diphosphate thiazole synthase [Desulfosalsimonas propionicica]MBA2879769.1 thiamine thiazole synthase [Desulfosalsimonas propionicica]
MALDEILISRAIIERYHQKLTENLETDVAIVGAGPSGLVAGYFLAKAGKKVVLFERKLSIGGGMWGGGMLFNEIVVQYEALAILDEFGIRYRQYQDDYYTADGVEAVASLTAEAVRAGLTIFNCISVEDVMMRPDRVEGLVINWSPVEMAGLHVDPLTVRASYVIDATGHDTDVVQMVDKKNPGRLNTSTGGIIGQKAMWADRAESDTTENTKEIFPGLYVAGMAANATAGGPRMGPIFGGMLLSGRKVARELAEKL